MNHTRRILLLTGLLLLAAALLMACSNLPDLPTRTPVAEAPADAESGEEEAAAEDATAAQAEDAEGESEDDEQGSEKESDTEQVSDSMNSGAAAKAVDLLGAWVDGGAPEMDAFDYEGRDGSIYQGTFEADILPLFTGKGVWYEGSRACDSCHFANSEASNHEMNLGTYEGIMAGGDVLSVPPGVPILGQSEVGATDYDWEHAKLRARMRNNRMPPGFVFDVTEENRDGYCLNVADDGVEVQEGEYGCEQTAVGLIAAWVDGGAPETDAFEYAGAQLTFERDVLPFFTENNMWFDGSQQCTGCHFGNTENSYHEMDLSSYAGIMAGGDVLSEPPGVPILGQSEVGATDYDWEHAKLKERLRNNRMPPGWEFDITEENRDGPYVLHGVPLSEADMDADDMAGGATTAVTTTAGTPTSTTTVTTIVVTSPDGTTTTTTETVIVRYAEGGAEAVAEGCAIHAVDLIGTWVDAGSPETDAFDYFSVDDEACSGTFEADILPLFTENDLWFDGAQACTGCHFDNSENSYHEMDLSTYEGIMAGGDVLSEPPGVPILGQAEVGATDYDWAHSKLRARLRNNRMPPGWEFDITEENRDGPPVDVNGTEVRAVDLIAVWVDAGAPETDAFGDYGGTFEADILPLFTENGLWFDGAQACTGCHFDNSENSYHEMDLSTYEGIMAGGDVLSEPPGVPILGQAEVGATDYDWAHSKLRARLRNNRMPPGWEFDITEENRDGPPVDVNGTEVRAVDLIAAWVDAGAPEFSAFGVYSATFEANVLPLFSENGAWFDGSQACTGCHFGNSENSYHEMDLSTYEGIMAGGDVLSEPPGVPILGQSEVGATDYDWEHAKLRERLRNNRMPPGWEFDITEENRDGPMVLHGQLSGAGAAAAAAPAGSGECEITAVDLLGVWADAGAPEMDPFEFTALDESRCNGTFEADILPLFTENGLWFDGAQACTGCHFDNSENSYHEMDLSTYEGIMAGGDVLSEPPGVPILGQAEVGATDYDWAHSKLRARLRNNRMPPGWEFDITEENRDGPPVDVNGTEVRAVDLIAAWVDAGAPEFSAFGVYSATFEANVQPLFSENGAWFEGSQACTGCHFGNSENSYHEMDLSTYEGIMAGGDVLSEPPGVPILGQTEVGATDYDWENAKLRERLRNNRMPPGWEFDITEGNRDGPTVLAGTKQ